MPATVLVVSDPAAPWLKVLERMPDDATLIVSNDLARLREAAPSADVVLNAEFRDPGLFLATFRHATRARWHHTVSAGVEHILTPELIACPVPLTNGRGVFRRPLGEWAVGAMLYFAYDFRRMLRQQEARTWEPFDTEELHGATLGIVGYGEIGRATAERAKPFGMRILALRRRPERSDGDALIDRGYAPAEIRAMLAECDYIVAATPDTPTTRGLIGPAEIAAMKPNAVFINIGRGPVIDERALVAALTEKRIRGAALDVFDTEPLPANHPFYGMANVLMSPHTADHTPGWRDAALHCFVENFTRFERGEELVNIVDKSAGY
jgi:phosphoglycerate dehydrogenase-like enzyme